MDIVFDAHAETSHYFAAFIKSMGNILTGNEIKLLSKDDAHVSYVHNRMVNQHPYPWGMTMELTAILFALNWFYRLFFVIPSVRAVFNFLTDTPRKVTTAKITKFAQAHMEMLFYTGSGILGFFLVLNEPWFHHTVEGSALGFSVYWWTNQPNNLVLSDSLIFFYVLYVARYAQQFLSVFLEPKRKDFFEMQLHHLCTCILVVVSFIAGYVKMGLVIMLLMDIADPFLHAAKQVTYLREVSGPAFSSLFATVADMLFASFALVFFITRVVCYPYIVFSCLRDNMILRMGAQSTLLRWDDIVELIGWFKFDEAVLFILLVIIMFLQFFWFYLLMKIVISVIGGNPVDDNRSDSEPDDDKKKK